MDLDPDLLEARYREATAAHAGVNLSFDRFRESVAARVAESGSRVDDLNTLDLFLAVACLERDPGAVVRLERDVVRAVRPSVERVCRDGPSAVDDVLQWTLEKLLVGGDSGPKLLQYTGRGPLLGWVRVIAIREALQDRRKSKRERVRDDAAMLDGAPPAIGIELAILRQQYASSFRSAVEGAIRCLTPEQRSLLRFHTRDGLSIDQIAPILGVHRATAARRLEKARADALDHTRRIIREEHGLSESEARSLCLALASEVDVSIGRALAEDSAR